MPHVVLEQKALEALASEPRIALLKALLDRQQTVTQLARVTATDKAGVFRHLQKLADGGLVEKDDDHGFSYYRLTLKGRNVVSPQENVRISLLLGTSVTAVGIMAYASLGLASRPEVRQAVSSLDAAPAFGAPVGIGIAALTAIACGLVVLMTSGYLVLRRLRPRRAALTAEDARGERAGAGAPS